MTTSTIIIGVFASVILTSVIGVIVFNLFKSVITTIR